MGTYTANKNLYMPSVGEQGWGDLMNTNLSTIDNFLKPITVSGSTYTFTGNHVGNQSGGSISATSISNSGTLTQTGTSTFTGKITANGGIGTKALTATSISNSGTLTQTGTSTFTGKITANGGVNDYEERITTLEAGEFETINAGTINATNIYGTVYHEFVKTQPYPWASAITLGSASHTAYQNSNSYSSWSTIEYSFSGSINLTQFVGITAIDNSLLTNYKVTANGSANQSFSNIVITGTDLLDDSNVYTYTFSPGTKALSEIIQLPVLCTIQCSYKYASARFNGTVSISPTETVYLK